jgi:hypothetical protein
MVGVYRIVRRADVVYKYLHIPNPVAQSLYRHLSKKYYLERFCHIIQSASKQKKLGKHIVEGFLLPGIGNYGSPWIPGLTLQEIKDISSIQEWRALDPTGSRRRGLLRAIHQLQMSIKQAHRENGFIRGDWALHNIVYQEDKGRVVNVDLEGFFTYSPDGPSLDWNPKEHHVPTILKTLRNLRQQLQCSLSYA